MQAGSHRPLGNDGWANERLALAAHVATLMPDWDVKRRSPAVAIPAGINWPVLKIGSVMPLQSTNSSYLGPALDGIRFHMRDGIRNIYCRISLEALAERGLATGLSEIEVFETFRAEIEQAASNKFDRNETEYAGGIYLTSNEFPPQPPSIK